MATRKPAPAAPALAKGAPVVLPKNEYGQGKRKLLDAATKLVAREGTTRLALRELAKEAGMSHNAIYRHFASVDDMVPEMILEFNQRLREGLRHARTQVPGSEPPTRTVVGWLFDFAKAHPDAFVVAMRERHGPSGPARQAIEQGMANVLADMRHDLLAAKRLPPLPDSMLDTALRVIIQHTFELCLTCLAMPERREDLLQEAEQVFVWCLSGAAMSAASGSAKPAPQAR